MTARGKNKDPQTRGSKNQRRKSSTPQKLRYKSSVIFARTAVLPLLLFLIVLDRHHLIQEAEVAVVLGLSVAISVIGYVLFLQTVGHVSHLSDTFHRVGRGEIEEIAHN